MDYKRYMRHLYAYSEILKTKWHICLKACETIDDIAFFYQIGMLDSEWFYEFMEV